MTYPKSLIFCLGLLSSVVSAQAGSIMTMGGAPEAHGKVTLTDPATLSIDAGGSSPDQVKLSDVIEADFSDADFHVGYFSSDATLGNALPSDWQTKDFAPVDIPGSCAYANGEVTLKGIGSAFGGVDDAYFFAGQPWKGSGQWTLHMKSFDPNAPSTSVGVMVRNSLDRGAVMACVGQTASGGGWSEGRDTPNTHAGWGDITDNDPVAWLRVTRIDNSISAEISPDGVKWNPIYQGETALAQSGWVGLFVSSHQDKAVGTATVDHVTFESCPPFPELISPGTELVDGSYLAGYFNFINPQNGQFNRNGKVANMTADKVANIVFHPTTAQDLIDAGAKPGVLMKNGDFLESDLTNVQGGMIQATSTALGPGEYYSDSVRACIVHPVSRRPYAYEVRLTDGSILNASGFDKDDHGITVHTVGGVDVPITADEISQIHAGTSRAQPLIRLPWTTSAVAAQGTPAPAANPVPATAPADSGVMTWSGDNQEQILAAPVGTSVSFPIQGKFGAAALRIAVGPGATAGTKVSLHLLADGHPIPGELVFTAGEQPRFMKITLDQTQKLTLVADSTDSRARILYIDPVALK